MKAGIVSYGVYIPKYRLKVAEIASIWGKKKNVVEKSLGVREKSVANFDEDVMTLAHEAAMQAFSKVKVVPSDIKACFIGSESHPYAVNPTSTIVAEFLGIGSDYLAVDLEFACKAATTGLISISGLIDAGNINKGLVIGSDVAQAKPHDILEYTASSGACAFILGKDNKEKIANLVGWSSFSSDVPDFWRRDGARFPSHAGRFTGEPAYYSHIKKASEKLLRQNKMKPEDFDYCVFHMPNGKFPKIIAKRLGFKSEQLKPSLLVEKIGNPYSANSLIGLSSVLDIAKPNQLIFMASYGSGAGSDAMIFQTTNNITKVRKKGVSVSMMVKNKKYISYVEYLKYRGKI